MRLPEHESLIDRFRQLRRGSAQTGGAAEPPTTDPGHDELRVLEARIAHLEQLVQGLQDSVHRESTRLSKRIGEVEARIQPAALSRTLSDDARDRGL